MNAADVAELSGAITNVRDRLLLANAALVDGDADKAAEELVAAADILRDSITALKGGAPA